MKTSRLASLFLITGLTLGATASQADGLRFFAGKEAGFKFEPTIALTGGVMNATAANDDANFVYGLDFNMNCGLIQTPTGVVRTKLSVNKFDKAGLELTTVELNPRWTIPVAKDLTFGVGPGIGWVKADGGRNVDMFAWQAGADLDYRIGQLNLGLGARWQDTVNKNLGGGREGADNWLVQAKVGIAF